MGAIIEHGAQSGRFERTAEVCAQAFWSIVDAVEPQVRLLLQEFPNIPSTVILERIGWTRGKTVIFDRIAQLRPVCLGRGYEGVDAL